MEVGGWLMRESRAAGAGAMLLLLALLLLLLVLLLLLAPLLALPPPLLAWPLKNARCSCAGACVKRRFASTDASECR